LSIQFGKVREKLGQWKDAHYWYRTALDLSVSWADRDPLLELEQGEMRQTIKRLNQTLGRVHLSDSDCKDEIIWLRPGRHLIKVDGKFEKIEVNAGEDIAIDRCVL
jgi:hypothetical protein